MQQLFAAAAQMQSQLMSAQQRLAETEIEGSAGGGLVKATINGQGSEGGMPGIPGLPGLPGFPGQPPLPGSALPDDPATSGEG
jgi:hypothetical protein